MFAILTYFIILVLTYSLTHIIFTIMFLFNYNLSKKKVYSSDNEASAPKWLRINILSHGLNSSLNRTQVSSMNATLVLIEISPNLGHEVNTLNITKITKILFNELRSSNKTTRSNSTQSMAD